MYKNNFLAVLIHMIISFVTFILFGLINSLTSNISIGSGNLLSKFEAAFTLLLAIALYLFSGLLLKKQKTRLRNIISVSGVSIIALCLWLVCFIITGGSNLGVDINWIPFVFYTTYALPVFSNFDIDKPVMAIIFAILPSLLMWISIQMWNVRNKEII